MSKVSIHCFTRIDDTEPAKTLEGDEYQAISDSATSHRVVLNPNHADPKKSFQVDVRDGARNSTDHLRFARVEVYEAPEHPDGVNVLVWYGDKDGGAKEVVVEEAHSPTFEEFTEAGYNPAAYPPLGYEAQPSTGYDYYQAHKIEVDAAWAADHPDSHREPETVKESAHDQQTEKELLNAND